MYTLFVRRTALIRYGIKKINWISERELQRGWTDGRLIKS
jgi:hypothetical protein